jgi:hypothetical protein
VVIRPVISLKTVLSAKIAWMRPAVQGKFKGFPCPRF